MAFAAEFLKGAKDGITNLARQPIMKMGMAFGMLLANPFDADAQKHRSSSYDERDYSRFGIGAAQVIGAKPKFDFHVVTAGFGKKGSQLRQLNSFEGGARLTGKSIGSSFVVKQPGRSIGYYAWSQQFTTAYLKMQVGPHIHADRGIFKGIDARFGVDAEFDMYPGGQRNLLNNADVSFGAYGGISKTFGQNFGVYADARYNAHTIVNQYSTNRYFAQNLTTTDEITGRNGLMVRAGLMIKF